MMIGGKRIYEAGEKGHFAAVWECTNGFYAVSRFGGWEIEMGPMVRRNDSTECADKLNFYGSLVNIESETLGRLLSNMGIKYNCKVRPADV